MSESAPDQGDAGTSTESSGKIDSVECPTCDRSDFKNRKGMKIHHAQAHGESIAREEFTCERCGDSFTALPSAINRFCGMGCKDATHSEEMSGESHPDYKGSVKVSCKQCKGTYEVKQSEVEGTSFCSRSCQWEWQENNWNKDNHPASKEWHKISCEFCDKTFKVKDSEKDTTRFCSRECVAEWRSNNIHGDNHPQYKPNSDYNYGANWSEQRAKARERDDYTCQICGIEEFDWYRELDVHHITPLSQYKREWNHPEWYLRGNVLENLITLCTSCHRKWEGIPLKPQRT